MSKAPTNKPSYLERVKSELLAFLEQKNLAVPGEGQLAAEDFWPFIARKLVESYWNGVRDGASGRVKPKQPAS